MTTMGAGYESTKGREGGRPRVRGYDVHRKYVIALAPGSASLALLLPLGQHLAVKGKSYTLQMTEA